MSRCLTAVGGWGRVGKGRGWWSSCGPVGEVVLVTLIGGDGVIVVGIRVRVMRGCADVVNQMSSCSGARLWDAEILSAGESVVLVVGDRREWWGFVVAVLFVVARVAHQGAGGGESLGSSRYGRGLVPCGSVMGGSGIVVGVPVRTRSRKLHGKFM